MTTPHPARPDSICVRRTYRTPALTEFGRISTLTQAASGCERSDNPGCAAGPPANMGPIPRLQR